ncbi:MAG: hypothetical protein R3C01_05045 [Planctomycetaceae bacterium]
MSAALLAELSQLSGSGETEQVLDRLIAGLQAEKHFHKLFDARMLKRKYELGLPLTRPTSLSDVPEELRKSCEETYIAAAREAGAALLAEGDIPGAWMYYRVIREKEPIATAILNLPLPSQQDETAEQIVQIALYEGVAAARGVEILLNMQGTCSTITTLDQTFQNLSAEDRRDCARVMLHSLHADLTENVTREVQQRLAMLPPGMSLGELISGRDWLFEKGNYHIDVSHLNAVVRFARSCERSEDLQKALELAEYGSRLDPQLQYGGEPPFDDFYPAHRQFFRALLNQKRDESLQYFRDKLAQEPDERDKPLLAYVLVDLLVRVESLDEAVDLAEKYLSNLSDDLAISFSELCIKAKRFDTLQKVMKDQGDAVGLVAALLSQPRQVESSVS